MFLKKLENHPELATEKSIKVFASESCLYGEESLNHRTHARNAVVKKFLLTLNTTDRELFHPLLIQGAHAMREKLCTYASNQLPGGAYWNPDKDVRSILKTFKPNNDICESIFGLNDWISARIPNLKQSTSSVLVEVSRNHTMSWLDQLPPEKQDEVVSLAVAI